MIIQGKVWGETRPLFNDNNVEIHLIKAKKGGYCSKHLHKSKFNKFLVIYGKLKVTIWKDYGTETLEDISILEAGMECTVSPGDYHRFEALEETQALEIYWVKLNESDITRLDHGGIKNAPTTAQCSEKSKITEFRNSPALTNWCCDCRSFACACPREIVYNFSNNILSDV